MSQYIWYNFLTLSLTTLGGSLFLGVIFLAELCHLTDVSSLIKGAEVDILMLSIDHHVSTKFSFECELNLVFNKRSISDLST